MRISDWSSDVCSSDLPEDHAALDDHGAIVEPTVPFERSSDDQNGTERLRAFREGDDRLNARFDDRVLEMQIVDRIGRDVEFGEDEEVCIFTGGLVCEIFGEFHVCMRAADGSNLRSADRRVGRECVSTSCFRWWR